MITGEDFQCRKTRHNEADDKGLEERWTWTPNARLERFHRKFPKATFDQQSKHFYSDNIVGNYDLNYPFLRMVRGNK